MITTLAYNEGQEEVSLLRYEHTMCWCGGILKQTMFHTAYHQCQQCGTFVLKHYPSPIEYQRIYDLNAYWQKRQIKKGNPPIDARTTNDQNDGRLDYWLGLINKYTLKSGLAIEVGCAHGVLLDALRRSGWQTIGIEVSEKVAEWTRRQTGLDVRSGLFPDVLLPSCDLFLAMDVIEHVYNPVNFAEKIAHILHPEGIAIIQTPLDEHDSDVPFGQRWRDVFDDIEHLFIFNRESIGMLFKQVGLEIIANHEKWIPCHEIIIVKKNTHSQYIDNMIPYLPQTKNQLFSNFIEWGKHHELHAVNGGWNYKERFYPDYLVVGGASYAIFDVALQYLHGKGIDYGCGYWRLPGSIPIDIQVPGVKNTIEDISEQSLDYVFSSHFLEHVDDWTAYILKWNYLLKKGGKLFLYLPHPNCKLWHRGSPMIAEGHRWIPTPYTVTKSIVNAGFRILKYTQEPDTMQSFYLLAEKTKHIPFKETFEHQLCIIETIKPQIPRNLSLANLRETFSGEFVGFMGILNSFANRYQLRQFTNWSKVWEYPWLWFHALSSIDWPRTQILDFGSEISPMPWFFASLGAQVTLIETDAQWIPTWEKIKLDTGLRVDWKILSQSERLPFVDRTFDLITSFSVIEHQEDKVTAIGEIIRVLKPGGTLAISFDICEPEMGMTFPAWNGKALTMQEFEQLLWTHSAFQTDGQKPQWNTEDCAEFIQWHLQSAPHHNYTVGAAILTKKDELMEPQITPRTKSEQFDLKACRNILIPRFDTVGDIVLLQGFLQALLDFLPKTTVTFLVREGYDQLQSLFPGRIRWKTTSLNPHKELPEASKVRSFIEELRAEPYDLVLITTYNRLWADDLTAAVISSAWCIAIGESCDLHDYTKKLLSDLGIVSTPSPYDEIMPVTEELHEIEKYQIFWERLSASQVRLSVPQLSIPINADKKAQDILTFLGLSSGNFVFCFPAGVANVSIKTWSAENFARVLTVLEQKYHLKAVVVGHKTEKTIVDAVIDSAKQHGAQPVAWLGQDGELPILCALLKQSLFYFGNDTGPMHLAAALRKPVIAVFGGGNWPRFLPCIKVGRVFVMPLPCFSCYWHCLFDEAHCVRALRNETVLQYLPIWIEEILHGTENFQIIEENVTYNQLSLWFKKAIERFRVDKIALLSKLQDSESDRSARFEIIQRQGAQLSNSEAERNMLTARLGNSEADRAARLEVIQQLSERLQASEADRAARLEVIQQLSERLQASEADRAARLEVIQQQGQHIDELSAQAADLKQQIDVIQAQFLIKIFHRLKLVTFAFSVESSDDVNKEEYVKKLKNDHDYFKAELLKDSDKVIDAFYQLYQIVPKSYVKTYIEHIKREHIDNPQSLLYIESELGAPLRQIQLVRTLQQCGYSIANKNVLDIGCSNGALLLACYESGAKTLTGIDIVQARLQSARRLIGNNKSIDLLLLDIVTQDLPQQDRTFDVIFSTDVLEHVSEVEQVFLKLKKYLSVEDKNNFIYLSLFNKYHYDNILAEPHYNVPALILLHYDEAKDIWNQLKEQFHSYLDYEVYEWFTFWQYQKMADKLGLVVEPFVDSRYINELDIRDEAWKHKIDAFYDNVCNKINILMLSEKDKNRLYDALKHYYDEFSIDHVSAVDSFESKLFIYMKYYAHSLQMILKHKT